MERSFFIGRIFLAFILTTVIFAGAFLLGYGVSYSKYNSLYDSQSNIQFDLVSLDLEKQLLGSSCELFDPFPISSRMDAMGSDVGILEKRFGKYDSKVLEQKKIYSILEVEHFLIIKEHNENCNQNIPIILFFYSNIEGFENQGERVGKILSSFKNKNNEVMVYSFDYDVDFNLIKILKSNYGLESPNSVVYVNNGQIIRNLENIDELEELIIV